MCDYRRVVGADQRSAKPVRLARRSGTLGSIDLQREPSRAEPSLSPRLEKDSTLKFATGPELHVDEEIVGEIVGNVSGSHISQSQSVRRSLSRIEAAADAMREDLLLRVDLI